MGCGKPLQRVKAVLLYSAALALIFIPAVSSQSERIGFVGGAVLLPCIYPHQLPDKVNVSWRDKDDRPVLDIINGREEKGDGRVVSYPHQYKNGNFSILIRDLRGDDAGLYKCYIHGVNYDNEFGVTLEITEKPADKVTSPPPPAAPRPPPAPRGAAVTSSLHLALLSAPLLVLLCFLK